MKLLQQLDEAEKAGTQGEWDVREMQIKGSTVWANCFDTGSMMVCANGFASFDYKNAELIALMRNNIRALINIAKAVEKIGHHSRRASEFYEAVDEAKEALAKLNGGNT